MLIGYLFDESQDLLFPIRLSGVSQLAAMGAQPHAQFALIFVEVCIVIDLPNSKLLQACSGRSLGNVPGLTNGAL